MRVAVLGAGYAGVGLARRLERRLPDDVELVVVDDTGDHLVQHEVHRVIRRPDVADEITIPLEELFDRAEVRQARVTDVDPDAGVAELDDGITLEYDVGAVCLGATPAYYDLESVAEHGTPLKSVADAREIRSDFLEVLDGEGHRRVVVGGAGLSGIQVAGELAALADEELGDGTKEEQEADPDADPTGDVEIHLVEMADAVAPLFPENFQTAVRAELEDRGVVVETGRKIQGATPDSVLTASGEIEADQFVWTGGIAGSAALGGDRPIVRHDLRLGERTFAVGDTARVIDADGESVPASAQSAVRQATVAAENISRLVDHRRSGADIFEPRLESYRFSSPGWLVSVGDGAVAQIGPTVWRGPAAKALKTTVGAGYLSTIGAVREAIDVVNDSLGIAGEVAEEPPGEAVGDDGDLREAPDSPIQVEVPGPEDPDGTDADDDPDE